MEKRVHACKQKILFFINGREKELMRNREPTSGYTRTDIIGNYDLHPTEGYEFPPRYNPKIALNSKTSAMFPLNKKINDKVRPVSVLENEPEPVIDKYMPQVKKHRSKMIYDAMVTTTAKQRQYAREKRLYDEEKRQAEAEVENQQIQLAKEKEERQRIKRMKKKQELDQTYKDQLKMIERRKQKEREEELQYEEELRQQNKVAQKLEDQRLANLRKIAEERREEFRIRNDELLMRKENRREKELEEDRRIQLENAEVQKRVDARAAEDERRRMIKTKRRSQVAEQRARDLAMQTKKNNDEQEAAESAASKAAFKHVQELKDRQEQLFEERHNDWLALQKEKQARRRVGTKKPFPVRKQGVDEYIYNQQQRKREVERVKRYQYAQMEERRRKEKEEIENDIIEDNKMLAATQAKYNQSLKQLQSMIPKELGITVPEYDITNSRIRTRNKF